MKRYWKISVLLAYFLGFIGGNVFFEGAMSVQKVQAQDPMEYLEDNYPQLTNLFRDELRECHAHYLFAVDVSLSMCKYEDNVKPALTSFMKAVPEGDRVTIIPFATAAEANKMGFDVTITRDKRSSMIDMIGRLYPDQNERRVNRAKYFDTNIFAAQQAVAKSIQENPKYDVNFVFYISDMMHCPKDNIDRQFTEEEMVQMKSQVRSAKSDEVQTRAFALELPRAGKPEGFILPQLKEIYKEWGVELEEQYVPDNAQGVIRDWFETQKDKIMFMKLQAIVIKENKTNPMHVETDVDIDGNVTAQVRWSPGKLYPKLTFDSTYLDARDFRLDCNDEYVGYSVVGEMNEKVRLGKIKHSSWGFHHLSDSLHMNALLPVPYQDELNRVLGDRPGPLPKAARDENKWIWTFIMPLWLTATLALLLLLYIIGVISAAIRNSRYCFSGKVTVYDPMGIQTGETRKVGKQASNAVLTFGKGGTPSACRVDDAEWQFTIRKKNGNPLLVFQKPCFIWERKKGYCATGRDQSGRLSYADKTMVKIKCGKSRSEETHQVKVQLI
ncbi:MAG: VWA domain-containing protein [Paludibacteraceae bacterium]|nr:VWA domain-containing protein [Paludibacteraceae bacterium]